MSFDASCLTRHIQPGIPSAIFNTKLVAEACSPTTLAPTKLTGRLESAPVSRLCPGLHHLLSPFDKRDTVPAGLSSVPKFLPTACEPALPCPHSSLLLIHLFSCNDPATFQPEDLALASPLVNKALAQVPTMLPSHSNSAEAFLASWSLCGVLLTFSALAFTWPHTEGLLVTQMRAWPEAVLHHVWKE